MEKKKKERNIVVIGSDTSDLNIVANKLITETLSGNVDSSKLYIEYDQRKNLYSSSSNNYFLKENNQYLSQYSNIKYKDVKKEYYHFYSNLFIKWYKDTPLKTFFQSLYCNEIALNIKNNILEESDLIQFNERLINKIEEKIKTIEEELSQRYIIIKIMLNNLMIITEKNIDECLKGILSFRGDINRNYQEDSKLLLLAKGDLYSITQRINDILLTTTDPIKHNKLLCIVYYLGKTFKSLYVLLFLISKIKQLNLCDSFELPEEFTIDLDCFTNGEIRKIHLADHKDTIDYKNEEITKQPLYFSQCSVAICSNIIVIYNPQEGEFVKYMIFTSANNNLIRIEEKKYDTFKQKKMGIVAYDYYYLLTFAYDDYKKNANPLGVINLLTLETIDSSIIEYDDIAKEVLFTKTHTHYDQSLIDEDDVDILKEEEEIVYSPENTAIAIEGRFIFIISPIKRLKDKKELQKKYLSSKYIYTVDIYSAIKQEDDKFTFEFNNSHVIINTAKTNERLLLDELFNSTESYNKFIVVNGLIVNGDGLLIYDTKMKKAITTLPEMEMISLPHDSNSVLLSSANTVTFLVKSKTDLSMSLKIYVPTSYESNLLYYKSPLYKDFISNKKTKSISNTPTQSSLSNGDNYLQNIFNVSSSSAEVLKDKEKAPQEPIATTPKKHKAIIEILTGLFAYYDITQIRTMYNTVLQQSFIAPYIFSIDKPTITLLFELIQQAKAESNEKELYPLLILLEYHLCQTAHLKIHSKDLFQSNDHILQFINLLLDISEMYPKTLKPAIGSSLRSLFQIIASNHNEHLEEILMRYIKGAYDSLEGLIKSKDTMQEFYCFVIQSVIEKRKVLKMPKILGVINQIMTILLEHSLKLNHNEQQTIKDYQYQSVAFQFHQVYVFLFTSAILFNEEKQRKKTANENANANDYSESKKIANKFINDFLIQINKRIEFYCEKNNRAKINLFPMNIFYYMVMTIIRHYESLGNEVALLNFPIILEIISKLSKLKYETSLNPATLSLSPSEVLNQEDRYDIIIDNYDFCNDNGKKVKVILPKLANGKDKLYLNMILMKEITNNTAANILNIISVKTNKVISSLKLHGTINTYCNEINTCDTDISEGIIIEVANNIVESLIKIRISNYLYTAEYEDFLLEPCVQLFNMMMKSMITYDDKDDSILSTRLFSDGFREGTIDYGKTKEFIGRFRSDLQRSSVYYENVLLGTINEYNSWNDREVKEDCSIKEIILKHENIIKEFNKRLGIVNDDKDKDNGVIREMIAYAFYSILSRENIVHLLDSNTIEHSQYLFEIYTECSHLKNVYLFLKANDTKATESILPKLTTLLNLKPITNSKTESTNELPSLFIIKDHIKTITQLLTNESYTMDSYQLIIQSPMITSFLTVISLKVIQDIIIRFNMNSEEKINILTNYYSLFSKQLLTLPSIHSSLKIHQDDTWSKTIISKAFNEVMSLVINHITTHETMSKITLSSYLNFILWKIDNINHDTINYEDLCSLFVVNNDGDKKKNINLIRANQLIFTKINDPAIMEEEIVIIDDYYLSKKLSQIFDYVLYKMIYYVQKFSSNDTNKSKFSLENKLMILLPLLSNQVQTLLQQLSSIPPTDAKKNNTQIQYPITSQESIRETIEKSIQYKTSNLLGLIQNITLLIKPTSTSSYYTNYSLWKSIILLLDYTNDVNTSLVFTLFKSFSKAQVHNLKEFYALLPNIEFNKDTYDNELFFDWLMMKKKKYSQFTYEYFIYWYKEIDSGILNYINKKISNGQCFEMLNCFGCKVNTLGYYSKVIQNIKLHLERRNLDKRFDQKELENMILEAYFMKNTTDEDLHLINVKLGIKTDLDNETDENNNDIDENDNVDINQYEDNVEGEGEGSENAEENNRYGVIHNQRDVINEDDMNVPSPQILLIKETNKSQLKFFYCNNNDFICLNEYFSHNDSYIPLNTTIVSSCLDHISKKLFGKDTSYTLKDMVFFIQIIKCLIQSSKENKEIILQCIQAHADSIKALLSDSSAKLDHSIITKEKIEEYFSQCVNDLPLETIAKEEDSNVISSKKNENNKVMCAFRETNILCLFFADGKERKLILRIVEYSLHEKLELGDMINDVWVIDMKEYQRMIDDEKNKDKNEAKTLMKDTFIFISDEVINHLKEEEEQDKPQVVVASVPEENKEHKEQKENDDKKEELKDEKDNDDKKEEDKEQKETDDKKEEELNDEKDSKQNENDSKKDEKESKTDKKDKSDNNKIPETKRWKQFVSFLSKEIQFSSCYFVIESKFISKTPLTIATLFYQEEAFSTHNLTNSTLPEILKSIINTQAIESKSFFDSIFNPSQEETSIQSLYKTIQPIFTSNITRDISENEASLETSTQGYFSFSFNFPSLSKYKTYKAPQLKKTGLFLIKYYLRILLLSIDQPIDLPSLTLLSYITNYNRNYFNQTQEYNLVKSAIETHLETIDIDAFLKTKSRVENDTLIVSEEIFQHKYHEEFLYDILRSYKLKGDATSMKKVFKTLVTYKNNYFNMTELKDSIRLIKIIMFILDEISLMDKTMAKEMIEILIHSNLLKEMNTFINDTFIKTPRQPKQHALFTINDFLLKIMIIIKTNNNSKQINYEYMNQLYKHYDIIKNKYSSPLIMNELCKDCPQYKQMMSQTLDLPISNPKFIIQYSNDQAKGFSLTKNKHLNKSVICAIPSSKNAATNQWNITNNIILTQESKESSIDSKEIFIIKDALNIKLHTSNITSNNTIITDVYQYKSNNDIVKDINGVYYQLSDSLKKMTQLNDLLKTDELVKICNGIIVCKKAMYVFSQEHCKEMTNVTKINSNLFRIDFPKGEKVIGAALADTIIVCWTESGKLYGQGGNTGQLIENPSTGKIPTFKEIKIPKGLKVVDAFLQYSTLLVYQAYDIATKEMRFFYNGFTYEIRLDDTISSNQFGKEIDSLKGKNCIKMFFLDNLFVALSKTGEFYYRNTSDYTYGGIHVGNFFKQKGLIIDDIRASGYSGVFIECHRDFDNKKFLYGLGFRWKDKRYFEFKNILHIDDYVIKMIIDDVMKYKNEEKENEIIQIKQCLAVNGLSCLWEAACFSSIDLHKELNTKPKEKLAIEIVVRCNDYKENASYDITLINIIKDDDDTLLMFSVALVKESPEIPQLEEKNTTLLYSFEDKSLVLNKANSKIIEELYQFVKVFKAISQLGIYIKDLQMGKQDDDKLKKTSYNYYQEPKTSPSLVINTIPKELLDHEMIEKLKGNIPYLETVNDQIVQEYFKAKEMYTSVTTSSNNKRFTFGKFLQEKYSSINNPYHCLCNIDVQKLIEKEKELINTSMRICSKIFPYQNNNDHWMTKLLSANSTFLPKEIKEMKINEAFEKTRLSTLKIIGAIDRKTPYQNKQKGLNDHFYLWSLFSQLFILTKTMGKTVFSKKKNKPLFHVSLINETTNKTTKQLNREIINEIINDLQSSVIDLLIPIKVYGDWRDCYTINPNSCYHYQLKMFTFIGYLFAYCLKSQFNIDIQLDKRIWKKLINDHDDDENDDKSMSEQIYAIRSGLYDIINESITMYLSWEELEERICGKREVNVMILERNTVYQGYTKDDQVVKFFWRYMKNCSKEERYNYIHLVYDCTECRFFPTKDEHFGPKYHKIAKNDNGRDIKGIPSEFTLLLPSYETYDEFKVNISKMISNSN